MTHFDNLYGARRKLPATCVISSCPELGNRGAVALLVGLSAPMLIMAIALGVEVSSWTVTKQKLQRTADMAALASAEAFNRGALAQTAATYGAYVAEMNKALGAKTRSWVGSTLSDNLITIQQTTGPVNINDTAFLATIQANVPLLFSSYVLPAGTTTKTITATATAEIITSQVGQYCVLALDSAATSDVSVSGGTNVNTSACGIRVNGTASNALNLSGGSTLTAGNVAVSGNYSLSGGSTMTVSGTTATGAAAGVNPYAGQTIPTPGTCASTTSYSSGTFVLSPSTFCGGLNISGGANVTLGAGIYIINGGNFTLSGGSTVTATSGVTIVLTGSSASTIGTAQISGGTTFNITAPTTGSTAGIAVLQNPLASSSSSSSFSGGSNMNITGALLFPSQPVNYSGGTSATATCTQLISYQVTFSGGSTFGNNCAGTGTKGIGATGTVNLVR